MRPEVNGQLVIKVVMMHQSTDQSFWLTNLYEFGIFTVSKAAKKRK
jgi:hypothetical protein